MSLFSNRQFLILYELLNAKFLTSSELAINVGVSVRTIKKEIALLKDGLEQFDIDLVSKPGKGYYLIPLSNEGKLVIKNFKKSNVIKKVYRFNKSNSDRVSHILVRLLKSSNYIKVDDLVEELFISRGSVLNDLKDVRQQLNRFHLKIVSKPSFGMKIAGIESDIRNALIEYEFNNDLLTERFENDVFEKDLETLSIIESALRKTYVEYRLSDFTYTNLALYFFITDQRVSAGYCINDLPYNPTERLKELTRSVSEHLFNKSFDEREIIYLSQHIDYKKIIEEVEKSRDKDILINKIQDEMVRNFGMDFYSLGDLMNQLYSHIIQMVKRVKNNMVIKNPITFNNLRDYPFASKLTISVVSIINEHYNINVGIDEFAYLVMYLELSIRMIYPIKKVTIVFDSGHSRVEGELFLTELKRAFEDKYTQVVEYDALEANSIFVTSQKSSNKNEISIQSYDYIQRIKDQIGVIRNDSIDMDKYLNEDSIIKNLKGSNRYEVSKNLWTILKDRGLLKDVPFTENDFVGLEVGNQVLHLQDYGKVFDKPIFMLAVLEKSIIWENTVIKAIVLIKTKRDGDNDLPILCSILSQWLNNPTIIAKSLENPDIKFIDQTY